MDGGVGKLEGSFECLLLTFPWEGAARKCFDGILSGDLFFCLFVPGVDALVVARLLLEVAFCPGLFTLEVLLPVPFLEDDGDLDFMKPLVGSS